MIAVYITAINLQSHSLHYFVSDLHTQSREHAPQNLTQYFFEYCFYRFVGIKHKSIKGFWSYFKLIVRRKKHIQKLHIFWSLSTFQISSSLWKGILVKSNNVRWIIYLDQQANEKDLMKCK